MTTYYSQHGEDVILDALFPEDTLGIFMEIGCIDGRRFSNTLRLEERGWKGICVEAHPDYIELIRCNRPGSIVVHAAVGEKDQAEVTFYANSRGSLSTLDKSLEELYRNNYGRYFTGFEIRHVPMRSISSILQEYNIPSPDVISIDIEGTELQAVQGIDFNRYRPRVIVVEADARENVLALDDLLLPEGYVRGFSLSCNRFYFSDPQMYADLLGREYECRLTYTEHPLDDTGDTTVTRTCLIRTDE